MKVALSGGSGVVGSALARYLIDQGHHVKALARDRASHAALTAVGAQVEQGDLLDPDSLTGLASGCEIFFNVAGINQLCARDSELMQAVNVDGVRNAIAACKRGGVRRLVHTSSAVTLGEPRGSLGTEASQHRGWFLSEYERTKFQGEQVLLSESGDLEVVAVNPSSVQGPGRATGTAKIILDIINGRLPFLVKTQVSLVDIEDCSKGHLLAATEGKSGERYVLSGSTIPVETALEMAAKFLRRELKPRFVPGWLVGIGVMAAGPAARLVGRRLPFCPEMVRVLRFGHRYDGSRAGTDLGLTYTPVEETIARTMSWFEAQGLIDQNEDPA